MPEELKHYGILGQRWGVRKENHSATAKRMTNEQLQSAISRMQLERQYSSLKNDEASNTTMGKGTKLVKEIVGNAAKQTATTFVAKQMSNLLTRAVEGKSK